MLELWFKRYLLIGQVQQSWISVLFPGFSKLEYCYETQKIAILLKLHCL